MKILQYVLGNLIISAIACSFALSTPLEANELKPRSISLRSQENARLVVNRAANFGVLEALQLYVDGTKVANLAINENYEGTLPPGNHTVSISTIPITYDTTPPAVIRINARPGETYAFTAIWDDPERASLVQ